MLDFILFLLFCPFYNCSLKKLPFVLPTFGNFARRVSTRSTWIFSRVGTVSQIVKSFGCFLISLLGISWLCRLFAWLLGWLDSRCLWLLTCLTIIFSTASISRSFLRSSSFEGFSFSFLTYNEAFILVRRIINYDFFDATAYCRISELAQIGPDRSRNYFVD